MKIAHFVSFAPKRSGLYETVRDLCLSEIELNHEAKLVDSGDLNEERATFRFDRGVDIANIKWACEADVFVLHSMIPQKLWGSKPTVLVLHGAPEYVFYSQLFYHKAGDGGHSTLILYSTQDWIRKCVTFWPRHVPFWQIIFGDGKVVLCPPPVRISDYAPDGDKHVFKIVGEPNVGFCDTWRPTFFKDPFQILAGFREYWKKNNKARLQLFGIPSDAKRSDEWGGVWDKHILAIKRTGDFLGEIYELYPKMADVYRALDMVITPTVDASRVVRESLSCGTPVIGPHGNKYANFTCNIDDPSSVSDALSAAWSVVSSPSSKHATKQECLNRAKQFDSMVSAQKFIEVLQSIV